MGCGVRSAPAVGFCATLGFESSLLVAWDCANNPAPMPAHASNRKMAAVVLSLVSIMDLSTPSAKAATGAETTPASVLAVVIAETACMVPEIRVLGKQAAGASCDNVTAIAPAESATP